MRNDSFAECGLLHVKSQDRIIHPIVSVVLSSPFPNQIEMDTESFFTLLHRCLNILRTQKDESSSSKACSNTLVGGGVWEMIVADDLDTLGNEYDEVRTQLVDQDDGRCHAHSNHLIQHRYGDACRLVATCLREMVSLLLQNSGVSCYRNGVGYEYNGESMSVIQRVQHLVRSVRRRCVDIKLQEAVHMALSETMNYTHSFTEDSCPNPHSFRDLILEDVETRVSGIMHAVSAVMTMINTRHLIINEDGYF